MAGDHPERKAVDSSEVSGMVVKDTDNEELGEVSSLQIDLDELAVAGIVVKRGWFENDVIVGTEYIDRIDDDTVWLNVDLTLFIEGRNVIDSQGTTIGTVEEVDRVRDTNTLKGLRVVGPVGETYVAADEIEDIRGDKVYLK